MNSIEEAVEHLKARGYVFEQRPGGGNYRRWYAPEGMKESEEDNEALVLLERAGFDKVLAMPPQMEPRMRGPEGWMYDAFNVWLRTEPWYDIELDATRARFYAILDGMVREPDFLAEELEVHMLNILRLEDGDPTVGTVREYYHRALAVREYMLGIGEARLRLPGEPRHGRTEPPLDLFALTPVDGAEADADLRLH
ncbi:hypothetical protein [Hyphomicrobium sp. CS1BSMeth3]|uniref:hypothetical protein n=1 Tax=Hyphomicrobium sp. CS1BSMeth3 TaxID=1892844 RepID=UPI00093093ED|nr:hypothetical protein [Hyphomicrobium sp. CS1BSMeth3]